MKSRWLRNLLKKASGLLVLLFLLPVTNVYAVKVTNLYQAELPAHSQSEREREKLISEGLAKVLIKVSGNPYSLENEKIKTALKKPVDLVEEYAYLPSGDERYQYLIQVKYSQAVIDGLLKEAGFALWGENRPTTLLWLVETDVWHKTTVIGTDKPFDVLQIIRRQEGLNGIPLILPMMDMADMTQIRPQDIVSMNLPLLREAANRYTPDAILIGQIQEEKSGFNSQWRLVLGNAQWNWEISDKSKEAVIDKLFANLGDTLAKHYVSPVTEGAAKGLRLQVSSINQPHDLIHLMDYLKQMSSLRNVELLQVSGDKVELSAQVRGSLESFQQNAALGRKMALKSQDGQEKLFYQWMH